MYPDLTSDQLREWAERCLANAQGKVEQECNRLSAMYEALIELAATQDWLEGRRNQTTE